MNQDPTNPDILTGITIQTGRICWPQNGLMMTALLFLTNSTNTGTGKTGSKGSTIPMIIPVVIWMEFFCKPAISSLYF